MVGTISPNFSDAIAELKELSLLEVNLPEALDHFAQTGLPLFVCEIDFAATKTTGNLVFSYKLSDQLKVSLSAVRARKLDSESVGINH
ncbi:MAG: hypothetical protein WA639_19270 [Candidatus Acidiferrum sp.]